MILKANFASIKHDSFSHIKYHPVLRHSDAQRNIVCSSLLSHTQGILHPSQVQNIVYARDAWSLQTLDSFGSEYSIVREIGRGASATVHLARKLSTSQDVAVKIISKQRAGKDPDIVLASLRQEVYTWRLCQKVLYTARLFDVCEDENFVYLIAELCCGGDARQLLQAKGALSEKEVAHIMLAILTVLEECHFHHIAHGDIKPANFLLKSLPVDTNCFLDIRVADFGCSQMMLSNSKRHSRGSPAFMAPELWTPHFGIEVDVWAAGISMFQLLTGHHPFCNFSIDMPADMPAYKLMCAIHSNPVATHLPQWRALSRDARDLIQLMLDRNPLTRISTVDALCHPWFQKSLNRRSS